MKITIEHDGKTYQGTVEEVKQEQPITGCNVKLYRKKPVVVEAMQITTATENDVLIWSNGAVYASPVLEPDKDSPSGMYWQIETLEGVMTATTGDWIIKGIKGEFYPCKPDIFDATYESIADTINRDDTIRRDAIPVKDKPKFEVGELMVVNDQLCCIEEHVPDAPLPWRFRIASNNTCMWTKQEDFTKLAPGVRFFAKNTVDGCKEVDEFVVIRYGRPKSGDMAIFDRLYIKEVRQIVTDYTTFNWFIVLPASSSPYWTFMIGGVPCVAEWENEPRSVNIRKRGDTYACVWHPGGITLFDDMLNTISARSPIHIAPKGWFNGSEEEL